MCCFFFFVCSCIACCMANGWRVWEKEIERDSKFNIKENCNMCTVYSGYLSFFILLQKKKNNEEKKHDFMPYSFLWCSFNFLHVCIRHFWHGDGAYNGTPKCICITFKMKCQNMHDAYEIIKNKISAKHSEETMKLRFLYGKRESICIV